MKTINAQIDIFTDLVKAIKAFDKSAVPCDLLEASTMGKSYFIDRSKSALKDWPKHYKLISTK